MNIYDFDEYFSRPVRKTKSMIPEYYAEIRSLKYDRFKLSVDYLLDFHNWLKMTPDEIIFMKLGDIRK